eukprot:TRINITY_DN19170_c0_g2_i1.p1 TRINITY_DN19170_c0_g2~~TRINITY_DN19170_c0_g2_i1.p1  ORF type:complete len:1274 (+),score=226.15 TRINITY_DN19170_c0_g2_i1:55-3876(+)
MAAHPLSRSVLEARDGSDSFASSRSVSSLSSASMDLESDDICSLRTVSKETVLDMLKARVAEDQYYSRVSSGILVAVNPCKNLPDAVRLEEHAVADDTEVLPPHVFGIAKEALRRLRSGAGNQAILISGESGAGKTESAKRILAFLTKSVVGSPNKIEDLIPYAQDILEAFGNATTAKNPNSSRFIKWLDVQLVQSGGALQVQCCELTPYCLETARVCGPAAGEERNFHIMYQLLHAPPSVLDELDLTNVPNSFRYLQQGIEVVPGVDDAMDFERTRRALHAFGINGDMEMDTYRTIAGVLVLGNCSFEACSDGCRIVDDTVIQRAASLLGFNPDELAEFLIHRSGPCERVPLSPCEAAARRDGLARFLYQHLFFWIVEHMNTRFKPPPSQASSSQGTCSLGILDIAGFENFQRNTLEQLLINLTNEHLQKSFNDAVFNAEIEDCAREGVQCPNVTCAHLDNSDCIGLIERILTMLDDQTDMMTKVGKKVTAAELATMITDSCRTHRRFIAPRFKGEAFFGLRHFAGDIRYTCDDWLEKNAGKPPGDADSLFRTSRVSLVQRLGLSLHERLNTGRVGRGQSTLRRFMASLKALMFRISRSELQFVRCIKPNVHGSPGLFVDDHVSKQLLCAGILEAVRIRQVGYRSRWPFADFVQRYSCIVPDVAALHVGVGEVAEHSEIARVLVEALQEHAALAARPGHLVIGRTKVLARAAVADDLERLLMRRFDAILCLQRACRRLVARKQGATLIRQLRDQQQRDIDERRLREQESVEVDVSGDADSGGSPGVPEMSGMLGESVEVSEDQPGHGSGGVEGEGEIRGDSTVEPMPESEPALRSRSSILSRIALFETKPALPGSRDTSEGESVAQLGSVSTRRAMFESGATTSSRRSTHVGGGTSSSSSSAATSVSSIQASRLSLREPCIGTVARCDGDAAQNSAAKSTFRPADKKLSSGVKSAKAFFSARDRSGQAPAGQAPATQDASQSRLAAAMRLLEEAKQRQDIDMLQQAIVECEAAGVRKYRLKEAQAVLEVAIQKDSARRELSQAVEKRQIPELLAAIDVALKARLTDEELFAANAALGEARKDEARRILHDAIASGEAAALHNAIVQGYLCHLEKEEYIAATMVLHAMRQKEARRALKVALEKQNVAMLREAIDQGESVFLKEEDMLSARIALVAFPSKPSITNLRASIQRCREECVSEQTIDIAFAALAKAEEAYQAFLDCVPCGVCMDNEVERSPMPCCGREGGSAVICSECLARCLQINMTCPFCRMRQH